MLEVVGVSVVWWLLATPPVLITLIYAVRRTRIWLSILAFSWGVAGSSTAESFYDILFAKRFDQKFAHAPDVALELSLFGAAAFSLLGLVLFGCTLALSIKKERRAIAPVYLPAIYRSSILLELDAAGSGSVSAGGRATCADRRHFSVAAHTRQLMGPKGQPELSPSFHSVRNRHA